MSKLTHYSSLERTHDELNIRSLLEMVRTNGPGFKTRFNNNGYLLGC